MCLLDSGYCGYPQAGARGCIFSRSFDLNYELNILLQVSIIETLFYSTVSSLHGNVTFSAKKLRIPC